MNNTIGVGFSALKNLKVDIFYQLEFNHTFVL